MQQQGLRCIYHNSGAFTFPSTTKTQSLGWIGQPDGTIRPEARALTRSFPQPLERNLTDRAMQAWQQLLPGPAWIMPKSHWAYELQFGGGEWLASLMQEILVRADDLHRLNNAAAVEFASSELPGFSTTVHRLLQMSQNSDFCLAFPDRPAMCTIHSHKQLWWTTSDDATAAGLERLSHGF